MQPPTAETVRIARGGAEVTYNQHHMHRKRGASSDPGPILPVARRRTVRLRPVAAEIVGREARRRGLSVNGAINELVGEWELLRRIRGAADLRKDIVEDLSIIRMADAGVMLAKGRPREELLRDAESAHRRIISRLAMVTAL